MRFKHTGQTTSSGCTLIVTLPGVAICSQNLRKDSLPRCNHASRPDQIPPLLHDLRRYFGEDIFLGFFYDLQDPDWSNLHKTRLLRAQIYTE